MHRCAGQHRLSRSVQEVQGPRGLPEGAIEELEKDIQPCGFYKNKAKNIMDACRKLVALHGGEVPRTMKELTNLGGVGRKTANVVMGECFGHQGVIVDTHCTRLVNRLGFREGRGRGEAGARPDEGVAAGALDAILAPHGAPRPRGVPGAQADVLAVRRARALPLPRHQGRA
jgi:hypothetical protein